MNFLQAPAVRDLEAFTGMPAQYRRTSVRSAWADANRAGAPVDSFLEGPVFDGAGNLYVTDIPFGRIFRIDAGGQWDPSAFLRAKLGPDLQSRQASARVFETHSEAAEFSAAHAAGRGAAAAWVAGTHPKPNLWIVRKDQLDSGCRSLNTCAIERTAEH